MVKVICEEDCGNAPKKLFLRDITIAFAGNDTASILENVTDDICWDIVGETQISGKKHFTEKLEQMKSDKTTELLIENISTHGYTGAVNGTMKMDSGKTYAYCNVHKFSSSRNFAKISKITSFIIAI